MEQSNCWVIVPDSVVISQVFEIYCGTGWLELHNALRLPVYGGQRSVADQLMVTVLEPAPGASPVTEKLSKTKAGCHGPGGEHHVPGGGGTDGFTGPISLGAGTGAGAGDGVGVCNGEGVAAGLGARGVGLCA